MKSYKHLFFDLDRTLWDFDTNADLTLSEIYLKFGLQQRGVPSETIFKDTYIKINEDMWSAYRKGEIEKHTLRTHRYLYTLETFGIEDPELAGLIGDHYVTESPRKTNLLPYTVDVLDYLSGKYAMHIITNGFSEVQAVKLQHSDLNKYFDVIVTSEMAGTKKPNRQIFDFSLEKAEAHAEESLMIGDDLAVDILGAASLGMDQVYFNPNKDRHEELPTFEIESLMELKRIL